MISKKAIVYKLTLELNRDKYFIIGKTLDLQQTKEDTYKSLEAGSYDNKHVQNLYNEIIKNIGKDPIMLYVEFEVLQSFNPDYYQKWLIPKLLEFVQSKYIEEAKMELKKQGKEYLLLNYGG